MKAVVLAAGEGKRLRPLTYTRPKPLFPVAGKFFIEHTLSALKSANIDVLFLIVGYESKAIRDHLSDGSKHGLKITYVEQKEQKGTAHAIGLLENFTKSEPFLVVYGDVLVKPKNFENMIKMWEEKEGLTSSILSVTRVEEPSQFGTVETKNGEVTKIVEKPKNGSTTSNLVNAGIYIFTQEIFDIIKKTKISQRGEFEVTDSIQIMINQGGKIKAYEIEGWWIDVGRPWDLLEANKLLLEENKENLKIEGEAEEGARIKGPVGVKENAIIRAGAYIIGPTLIDKDADIGPNCFIRPHTYLAEKVHIGNACEVKNSIILRKTQIGHLSYVGDSIIGENCNFGAGTKIANLRHDDKPVKILINGKKISSGRRKLGVIMGDNTKTGIGSLIMPGATLGPNSALGPGAICYEYVPPNTFLIEKREKEELEWPPEE
ncbi:MAG: bifunctional sugar-1-phosphate nucleotidylyltransferase/acetyltransferase [Asgard group archaeon]